MYGRLPVQVACGQKPDGLEALSPAYVQQAAQTVRVQLAKAAVRLAALLNATLG